MVKLSNLPSDVVVVATVVIVVVVAVVVLLPEEINAQIKSFDICSNMYNVGIGYYYNDGIFGNLPFSWHSSKSEFQVQSPLQ